MYKHGIYGEIVPSQEQISNSGVGTIPVYIGTAPIHRIAEPSKAINTPMIITSLSDAIIKTGYSSSDNFDTFTLSAAIYGHFENKIQPIGPIVLINALDPSIHKSTGTASVTLVNGKGYINDQAIMSSVTITGKVKDEDYSLEYDSEGKLVLSSIDGGLTSPVQVSYEKIDISTVKDSDIIGKYDETTGRRTGIACVEIVYEKLNIVPSLVSAPGWNHKPNIEAELVKSCFKIGGRWEATAVTDIDPSAAKTIDEANDWKSTNGYKNLREKVCWPKVKVGSKTLWLSILAIVRMQQTDYINGNVPYESPSNKQLDITGLVLGDGTDYTANLSQANKLNEEGITTGLFFGGRWVLWGPHMANYKYGVTTKPEEIFDVNIRTNLYLINDFNMRNSQLIDTPIQRSDIDYILSTEQLRLNSLISDGKLFYGAINFNAANNPTQDIISGDFIFDTKVTNTPPGKSITNRIQYTSQGLNSLVGGEDTNG